MVIYMPAIVISQKQCVCVMLIRTYPVYKRYMHAYRRIGNETRKVEFVSGIKQ